MTHVGHWGQWLSSTCPGRSPCEQLPGVYSRTSLRCRRTISLLVCLEDDCHLSFPALLASRDDDFASCICVQTVVASCMYVYKCLNAQCVNQPIVFTSIQLLGVTLQFHASEEQDTTTDVFFWSNTLELTSIVCSWSITNTDSVLCASENCVILQSIRNTSIAPRVTRVCKSGYPLSGYPDLSVNFTAAKNPDILMIDSRLLCNKSM